jgi:hypothetical protein
MLNQPQLIGRGFGSAIGEVVHGLGYRLVGLQPQLTQNDLVWLQKSHRQVTEVVSPLYRALWPATSI